MKTRFVSKDGEIPLSEHPNPYFERPTYISLNGKWDFSLSKDPAYPTEWKEEILVPFAVETPLSGIGRKVEYTDYMHYRRKLVFPEEYVGKPGRIVFTAVDQVSDVFLDEKHVARNEGGYLPFEIQIEEVKKEMELYLLVRDDTDSPIYPRGKQSNKPSGIWYTPTSGIYGPVYFESLPKEGHIEKLEIYPDYETKNLTIKAGIAGDFKEITVNCYHGEHLVGEMKIGPTLKGSLSHENDFYPWSEKTPSMYRYEAKMGDDLVTGYYSFRKVERRKLGSYERIFINDEPVILNGVLDQGYCPESGLTYPSYRAMESDIEFVKSCGFNYIRKHIKVEPLRFYFMCEEKGIYVGQDFVNAGSKYSFVYIALRPFLNFDIDDLSHKHLGMESKDARDFFEQSINRYLEHFAPAGSIVLYTLFNEGWGQFDSDRLSAETEQFMPKSYLLDSTSGWYDKGSGDFFSRHIYFRKPRMENDGKRVLALSEFGGYSLALEGHLFKKRRFGYRSYKDKDALLEGIRKLYLEDIVPLVEKKGLSVLVYTQLSDVEGEINGLLTYDREVSKVAPSAMNEINRKIYEIFDAAVEKEN